MKILVLSSAGKSLDNSPMWRALGAHAEVELHFLDKPQQRNLRRWFKQVDVRQYDRIVLDLMFKHIHTQARFLRSLPGLVLYEEDAYLDAMPGSKWLGCFSALYHKLPGVRVISTGHWVAQRLCSLGIDACFVAKGFDAKRLFVQSAVERDIFLGFIGRTGSSAYAGRHQLLSSLAQVEPLQILRTQSPDDYPALLNRIRCFVSADIGLKEYMAKNFEAMACGCLLLAKRQGDGEEEALGFVDARNLILYDDLADLRQKIEWVRQHPDLAGKIARAGCEWVTEHNEYARLAEKIHVVLARPFVTVDVSRKRWWKWW